MGFYFRLATGVYSHPCSDTPHWHIHVPVLPVADEIPSAPRQISKGVRISANSPSVLSNIGKTGGIAKRKMRGMELQYFLFKRKQKIYPLKYVIYVFFRNCSIIHDNHSDYSFTEKKSQ
ncbi:hypothetical protein DWW33_08470 [Roseburia sp. AF15-21]|nr:hypothetical protein DWW33_08470 [Roseburia sp. AF15-21]